MVGQNITGDSACSLACLLIFPSMLSNAVQTLRVSMLFFSESNLSPKQKQGPTNLVNFIFLHSISAKSDSKVLVELKGLPETAGKQVPTHNYNNI